MAKMNSNIETIGLKIKKKLLNLQRKVEDKEREIFHTKFPKDPKLLYQELLKHKKEIDKLRNKNVINDKQYELIFPINKETDSDQWDPTLLHTLLRTLFGYKRPVPIIQSLSSDPIGIDRLVCFNFNNKLKVPPLNLSLLWCHV